MTVFFGLWKDNPNIPPPAAPSDQVKQFEGFAAAIKMQKQSGDLKEVHAFPGTSSGYFISGDVSAERLDQDLELFIPWVIFEVHQTIPIEKALENAVNAAKMRASQM